MSATSITTDGLRISKGAASYTGDQSTLQVKLQAKIGQRICFVLKDFSVDNVCWINFKVGTNTQWFKTSLSGQEHFYSCLALEDNPLLNVCANSSYASGGGGCRMTIKEIYVEDV